MEVRSRDVPRRPTVSNQRVTPSHPPTGVDDGSGKMREHRLQAVGVIDPANDASRPLPAFEGDHAVFGRIHWRSARTSDIDGLGILAGHMRSRSVPLRYA